MFAKAIERGTNGWALGREAFQLMKQHPKLIVFPLLAGITFLALLAAIATGAFLKPEMFGIAVTVETTANGGSYTASAGGSWLPLVWGFGLYLTLAFIGTFFNVALCSTILSRHLTGRISLLDGFVGALRRLPYILAWSAFAATIGVALAVIKGILDEYLSWVGWIFGSLLETAWATTIYFVAPVLAVERVGPITALKQSATLLKSRWGEAAGAEFSNTWALWPLHVAGIVSFIGLFASIFFLGKSSALPASLVIFGALCAIYVLASITLHSIMSGILKSHMYLYAKTGEVPAGSDPQIYARAFSK